MMEYVGYKDYIGNGQFNMGVTDERIIRCRECKWFRENATPHDTDGRYNFCTQFGFDFKGSNGFCAWGER